VVLRRDCSFLEFWDITHHHHHPPPSSSPPDIIHIPTNEPLLTFTFGPPKLWQHFAIYLVLDRRGHGLDLKVMCPVIPKGTRVEAIAMLELQDQLATILTMRDSVPQVSHSVVVVVVVVIKVVVKVVVVVVVVW